MTHAGSRTFQYAAEEVFTASISRGGVVESRTPSSGSLSGGSNLAASGFAEIHREEAEGAEDMARSPGGGWMRWSSYKDKAE